MCDRSYSIDLAIRPNSQLSIENPHLLNCVSIDVLRIREKQMTNTMGYSDVHSIVTQLECRWECKALMEKNMKDKTCKEQILQHHKQLTDKKSWGTEGSVVVEQIRTKIKTKNLPAKLGLRVCSQLLGRPAATISPIKCIQWIQNNLRKPTNYTRTLQIDGDERRMSDIHGNVVCDNLSTSRWRKPLPLLCFWSLNWILWQHCRVFVLLKYFGKKMKIAATAAVCSDRNSENLHFSSDFLLLTFARRSKLLGKWWKTAIKLATVSTVSDRIVQTTRIHTIYENREVVMKTGKLCRFLSEVFWAKPNKMHIKTNVNWVCVGRNRTGIALRREVTHVAKYVYVFSGTEQSVSDRMCSANAMNVTSFLCFSVVVRMFFRWTVPCCDEWFLHRRERRYNSSPMHYKAYECADLCCVLCACEICGMHLHVIRSNKRKSMFWREKKQNRNEIKEWKSLKAEKNTKIFRKNSRAQNRT